MANRKRLALIALGLLATFPFLCDAVGQDSSAVALPEELPLWEKPRSDYVIGPDIQEQVRSARPRPDSPTGLHRAFSSVTSPTYSIHRPRDPNGVGLVICPGGGFRDVWIDFEGHDLAIWLKDHGVTSLVLKYRTRPTVLRSKDAWQNYQRAVRADGRQAIRILRKQADDLGLQPNKIGICGFSAGGHLAIGCSLYPEPKTLETKVSGRPNFAGLFYPGIPDDVGELIESRTQSELDSAGNCPFFIVNARDDQITPVDKCVDFYATLLQAGFNAEIHVFSTGAHGFGMGDGRGKSTAIWPTSFVAWLRDSKIIKD
ncbi:MAG: alpha/beta hydrolase [Fuerstiella sp.]|nr:alpha/beta hydrolase [Fuerstiella sp.]MCP4858134.1 alpha/beta hydrolase [Fuerstiella sp.]